MSFTDFIEEKTPAELAVVFDFPVQTIYSWKRRNRIPPEHWNRLIERYSEISWKILSDMETARKQAG